MAKRKLVVVGGGFGGIKVCLSLQHYTEFFDITLISDTNSFEYNSALYRSATGWSPKEVVVRLGDIFDKNSKVEVVNAQITEIDPEKKFIKDSTGNTYQYDDAVLSLGQVTNYYGIKGMEDMSFGLNTIREAIRLREHLRAQVIDASDKKMLDFVIIGGGATGVELASELRFFVEEIARKHGIEPKTVNVTLIEGTARILPLLAPKSSKFAEWRLRELGVNIKLNTMVEGVEGNVLKLDNGEIETETIVWTAGATNNPFFKNNEQHFNLARNGKVEVDEYLRGNESVFVLGDNANTQYSGMAQTALFDAKFVADNLLRLARGKEAKLYVPHRPIYAIPVGQDYAVIQWGSKVLRGYPAWILRRVADLRLFLGFEPYRKAVRSWRAGNRRAKGFEIN
jgi:NADH dehydrogenase